ncbi:HGL186Wp [Eremothecium sinecaudum]|uniref:HGL186Wp n=1 Tax=Eremothecium sinecaudum TaxID=45286 RepID=A0A0X8HV94_9SACH|nr:HGL186Wp [Eremothecium sinecaudum]AMD22154.1 HGL186Wp [Eremothecium sinecaudum]
MSKSNTPIINFINFNQTGTCISVGTSEGLKILNCDPFGRFYSDEDGGCGIVEMLFSTSLVAVVGIGDNPAMSPRRLRIINTKRHSVICEVTFPTTILAVKMNKSRLVVLLHEQIYIYDISSMRLLYTIETSLNPHGLISLSASLENNYLAYPSPPKIISSEIKENATTNNINVTKKASYSESLTDQLDTISESSGENLKDYHIGGSDDASAAVSSHGHAGSGSNNTGTSSSHIIKNGDVILFNLQTLQPTMVIEAHKGEIAALALSKDGSLLATASEKGTIIRVFAVETCQKVYQFRRGTYPTRINSLSFSEDNEFLAASSSNKTVHIFKLGKPSPVGSHVAVNSDEEQIGDDEGEEEDEEEAELDYDEEDVEEGGKARVDSGYNRYTTSNVDSVESDSQVPREPIVDSSRKTVGRMIRKSSQTLSRKAAKALGNYFPIKVTSILEPSRHFASLKIPIENANNIKTICAIGSAINLDISEYPELFEGRSSMFSSSISTGEFSAYSNSSSSVHPNFVKMIPIKVVSSEGYMYIYVLDPERGGDCLLLSQYSLLMD